MAAKQIVWMATILWKTPDGVEDEHAFGFTGPDNRRQVLYLFEHNVAHNTKISISDAADPQSKVGNWKVLALVPLTSEKQRQDEEIRINTKYPNHEDIRARIERVASEKTIETPAGTFAE